MSVLQVPRWLIRKAHERAGERLPKRILLVEAKTKKVVGFPNYHIAGDVKKQGEGFTQRQEMVFADTLLKFENWEYRYWAVEFLGNKPACAECRCCGRVTGVCAPRKTHAAENNCYRKLTNAYQLLLRDMKCAICDAKTLKKCWGVPMCSSVCEEAWMHGTAQPDSLNFALKIGSMATGEPV